MTSIYDRPDDNPEPQDDPHDLDPEDDPLHNPWCDTCGGYNHVLMPHNDPRRNSE